MKKIIVSVLITLLVFIVVMVSINNQKNEKQDIQAKLEVSKQILEEQEIEWTNEDQTIVEDVIKNKEVEYAYVLHSDDTMMLKIKFNKDVEIEKQYEISNEYLNELQKEYPDNNINTSLIVE